MYADVERLSLTNVRSRSIIQLLAIRDYIAGIIVNESMAWANVERKNDRRFQKLRQKYVTKDIDFDQILWKALKTSVRCDISVILISDLYLQFLHQIK